MNPLHSPVYLENGNYLMVLGHWRASSVQYWPFALLANTQGNIPQTEAAQWQHLPHQHKPTQEVTFLLHHIQYNKTGEISAVWRESRRWHSGSKIKEIVSFHSIPQIDLCFLPRHTWNFSITDRTFSCGIATDWRSNSTNWEHIQYSAQLNVLNDLCNNSKRKKSCNTHLWNWYCLIHLEANKLVYKNCLYIFHSRLTRKLKTMILWHSQRVTLLAWPRNYWHHNLQFVSHNWTFSILCIM
jgi:hypothetical protein